MPQPFWEVHAGEGPFLLLVHGFLSSRSQWLSNLKALQQHCQPVVMELYGHGRSPSPNEPGPYHAAAYVQAMEAIRSKLGAK
ncbi:MAG: alpha/beta fold hydrolase, partial [Pseudomonadales bacterium]|nr:alpha/beta fold hydrolase [Pseudomonadales bacterium]